MCSCFALQGRVLVARVWTKDNDKSDVGFAQSLSEICCPGNDLDRNYLPLTPIYMHHLNVTPAKKNANWHPADC